jgi:4'-phosphopantetheinyl transferase
VGSDIHLWHLRLDRSSEETAELARVLSADELERARRFRDPRWRSRFIVGRATLRQVLARRLKRRPEQVRITYLAAGKPALDERDDCGLYFNVTHSQGSGLIALCTGQPVGIDIERVRPEFAVDAIARRFFSPREQADLLALDEAERALGFFRCWTRKEAFIKATGAGLSFPLDEFDVSLAPGVPAELLAVRGDVEAARRWSLREIPAPAGHVAALAVPGPIDQMVIEG